MHTTERKQKTTRQLTPLKSKTPAGARAGNDGREGLSRYLQRTVGNQAVQRLLNSGDDEAGRVPMGVKASSVAGRAFASPGRPLDESSRAAMEPLFEHDFSNVRVHTGSAAAASASAVNARAYTLGRHIFFRDGQYAPHTVPGRRLLAHELTHVVQQDRARSAGAARPASEVSTPDVPAEREAGVAAEQVAAGRRAQVRAEPASLIHRDGEELPAFLGYSSATGETTRLPVSAPPAPNPIAQLNALELRQTVSERRIQMLQMDNRWAHTFNERLLGYQQAIWRISHAINTAVAGFQQAQSVQAQTDAISIQATGFVISVGAAVLFEPLTVAALGALGSRINWVGRRIAGSGATPRTVRQVVEGWENPALAAVGGYVANIRGTAAAIEAQREGQTPATHPAGSPGEATAGDAMSFLTSNMETLVGHQRQMEGAFAQRARTFMALSDFDILMYDPSAAEAEYQAMLDGLNQVGAGVELLKSEAEIALIYERYMWAAWLRQETAIWAETYAPRHDPYGDSLAGNWERPIRAVRSIGTDIERRLTEVGVARLAQVTLTGEEFSSNSPDNWRIRLAEWATQYRESIANRE